MNAKNGTLYIVLTALAFGTMEIALKIAGSSFTTFQLTFLRFFIGFASAGSEGFDQKTCASDNIGLGIYHCPGDN